jgi:hypothetical protein
VQYLWALQFGAGGLALLYGVAAHNMKYEAVGCALFAGGAAIEAAAFGIIGGTHGFGVINTTVAAFNLGVFALAAFIRMTNLMRGNRLVLVHVLPKQTGPGE